MRKVEWVRNNCFFVIIIAMLFGLAVVILLELLGCIKFFGREKEASAGELLQSLILCVGVIGGVYGLHLATKRQKTFSEQVQGQSKQVQEQSKQVQVLSRQVQVQADQSFNERLGRGVELLANENVVMRCAGVQILKDLAENADDRQKPITAKIIYDFFRDNVRVKYESGEPRHRTREDSVQDLQDALELLVNLPLGVRAKLRVNREGQLDFHFLDFSYLILKCKKLEQIDFSSSRFVETKFQTDEIKNVDLTNTKFEKVVFNKIKFARNNFSGHGIEGITEFTRSEFIDVDFMNIRFSNVAFTDVIFKDISFKDVKFYGVFLGGTFGSKNTIEISSQSDLPTFESTEIKPTKFNFSVNKIQLNSIFYSCYYHENEQLSMIIPSREYEKEVHGFDVFVKSDEEDWSEKPVKAQVAVECIQWKLKARRKWGDSYWLHWFGDKDKLEAELEKAQEALSHDQYTIERRKKEFSDD